MDWSNERYARLYTRDTTTWKLFTWEARFVLMLLIRKVDRSGVMDVGEDGVEGLAALIEVPLEIARAGVPQLLQRGTLVQAETCFVLVNYLTAQEAKQSDAQRKRESREWRRAKSLSGTGHTDAAISDKRSHNVTERPESDEIRTNGHTNPIRVTPSLAEPNRAEPSRVPRARDPGSAVGSTELALTPEPREPDPKLDIFVQSEPEDNQAIGAAIAKAAARVSSAAPRGTTAAPDLGFGWSKLSTELWRAGGERYRELRAEGVDPGARDAWGGLPDKLLGGVIEYLRDNKQLSVDEARQVFMGALDTAEAVARSRTPQTLLYLTPSRFLPVDSFKKSAESTPDQVQSAASSRNGPVEPLPRKIARL